MKASRGERRAASTSRAFHDASTLATNCLRSFCVAQVFDVDEAPPLLAMTDMRVKPRRLMKKQKICRKMYGTPRRKTRGFRIGSMSSLLLFRMKTNALGTY